MEEQKPQKKSSPSYSYWDMSSPDLQAGEEVGTLAKQKFWQ